MPVCLVCVLAEGLTGGLVFSLSEDYLCLPHALSALLCSDTTHFLSSGCLTKADVSQEKMVPIQERLLCMIATDFVTTTSLVCVGNPAAQREKIEHWYSWGSHSTAAVLFPSPWLLLPVAHTLRMFHVHDPQRTPIGPALWVFTNKIFGIRIALQVCVKSTHLVPWKSKAIPQDKLIRQVAGDYMKQSSFLFLPFPSLLTVVVHLQT